MTGASLPKYECEGWWEQAEFGRQPMEPLQLSFHNGRIQGAGNDIIAPFTISGTVTAQGVVVILKQYERRHSVDYLGHYDGEGVMAGEWQIDGYCGGRWMIRIRRLSTTATAAHSADIPEFAPPL